MQPATIPILDFIADSVKISNCNFSTSPIPETHYTPSTQIPKNKTTSSHDGVFVFKMFKKRTTDEERYKQEAFHSFLRAELCKEVRHAVKIVQKVIFLFRSYILKAI